MANGARPMAGWNEHRSPAAKAGLHQQGPRAERRPGYVTFAYISGLSVVGVDISASNPSFIRSMTVRSSLPSCSSIA
jgi:hypothetical protein